jgi:hypothetical protein
MKTFNSFSELANAMCPNSIVTATCNRLNQGITQNDLSDTITENAPPSSFVEIAGSDEVIAALNKTNQTLDALGNILEERKKQYMQYVGQLRTVVANPQQTQMIQKLKPELSAFLQKLTREYPKGAKYFEELDKSFAAFADTASKFKVGSAAQGQSQPQAGQTPAAQPVQAGQPRIFNPAA